MGACEHVSWQLRQPNRGSSQASSVNPAKHADTDRYTCDCQARKPRIDTEFAQPREPNEPTQHITFCNLSAEIFTIQANSHYHQYSTIRIGNKQQSKTKQNKTGVPKHTAAQNSTAQHSHRSGCKSAYTVSAHPPLSISLDPHRQTREACLGRDHTLSPAPPCSSLLSSSLPPFRSLFCFSLTCRGSW